MALKNQAENKANQLTQVRTFLGGATHWICFYKRIHMPIPLQVRRMQRQWTKIGEQWASSFTDAFVASCGAGMADEVEILPQYDLAWWQKWWVKSVTTPNVADPAQLLPSLRMYERILLHFAVPAVPSDNLKKMASQVKPDALQVKVGAMAQIPGATGILPHPVARNEKAQVAELERVGSW